MELMGRSSRDNTKMLLAILNPGRKNNMLNIGLFLVKISRNNYLLMKYPYQMENFIQFLLPNKQKAEKEAL